MLLEYEHLWELKLQTLSSTTSYYLTLALHARVPENPHPRLTSFFLLNGCLWLPDGAKKGRRKEGESYGVYSVSGSLRTLRT
jgi:hypothetical protein